MTIAIAACLLASVGIATVCELNHAVENASARASFCTDLGSISGARVTRVNAFPSNKWAFTFPANVSITSAARALAGAICGLPRFPAGVYHCPNDFGLSYIVRFTGWKGRISIDPSGCEAVKGVGPVRRLALSPTFWRKLGRAMGLANATAATFRGRMVT